MTPGNRRFIKTALAILGLMALATAVLWIALFMFVKPARGDTIDPRMLYVIDGDTLALAGERIRLLGIDAPETRDARCERERVAGYETKARVVDLLRFGRSVEIPRPVRTDSRAHSYRWPEPWRAARTRKAGGTVSIKRGGESRASCSLVRLG